MKRKLPKKVITKADTTLEERVDAIGITLMSVLKDIKLLVDHCNKQFEHIDKCIIATEANFQVLAKMGVLKDVEENESVSIS